MNKRIYISKIQQRMFFLSFATAFIAAFTQTLAVLIDNIIVCAFYGETEIAAVTVAGPFFYILEIPAAGLAVGIQTVCAKDIGAGQVDKVNRLFNQLFFFIGAVMLALTVLSFLFTPQMAVMFGARGNTAVLLPLAEQYIYGLSFEIVPYVLFCIMTPVVILDDGGRLVSIASAGGCITNIVLDLLSVRFGWGLFGIGVASSASAAVYFLITMLHFVSQEKVIKLHFVRMRFSELKDVFIASAPKAVLSLADTLRSVLFISLVSITGGVVGACVLSINGTIAYTVMIIAKGIAGAVGIMTGICWGEKNGDDLEGNGVLAHRYTLVAVICVVTVLLVCARPLSYALTESDASAELLRFAIYLICLGAPFSILVQARISYLQAIEHVREAQWMGIASNLVILTIAALLYVVPFGVRGVFMAFSTAPILTLLVSLVIHSKRSGKAFPAGDDYLELDDSFYTKPGDVISYPLESIEDCALASEQVVLFCRGHKIEDRKCFLAGVCFEELTTNSIEHGIKNSKGIKTADIRVVIDSGDVIIRLRDGGRAFNLKNFAERMERDDNLESGIGIKIIMNSVKNVSYYRTYGMNTTIIKI